MKIRPENRPYVWPYLYNARKSLTHNTLQTTCALGLKPRNDQVTGSSPVGGSQIKAVSYKYGFSRFMPFVLFVSSRKERTPENRPASKPACQYVKTPVGQKCTSQFSGLLSKRIYNPSI